MTPAPMPAPMPLPENLFPFPLRDRNEKERLTWVEGTVPDPAYLAHLVRPCACDACRKGPTQ